MIGGGGATHVVTFARVAAHGSASDRRRRRPASLALISLIRLHAVASAGGLADGRLQRTRTPRPRAASCRRQQEARKTRSQPACTGRIGSVHASKRAPTSMHDEGIIVAGRPVVTGRHACVMCGSVAGYVRTSSCMHASRIARSTSATELSSCMLHGTDCYSLSAP